MQRTQNKPPTRSRLKPPRPVSEIYAEQQEAIAKAQRLLKKHKFETVDSFLDHNANRLPLAIIRAVWKESNPVEESFPMTLEDKFYVMTKHFGDRAVYPMLAMGLQFNLQRHLPPEN